MSEHKHNRSPATDRVIPPHGGYEDLLSFQKSRIVYDATVEFCERFISKYSRTHDQMVQAARSGKQNILEGSQASGTSKEAEIKLTNVARASLEELLEDYRDFLRSGGHAEWDKNSKEALYVRKLSAGKIAPTADYGTKGTNATNKKSADAGNHHRSPMSHKPHSPVTFETFRPFFETRPPEILANIIISLIHQTNYLLDQQIRHLEQDFLKKGGLRERMTRARLAARNNQRRQ
ncbi:MAG: four helix bundle protein [Lentisphaerae bacterium]|nr:four helix bundle protein [Lentisphaerota bacterium]